MNKEEYLTSDGYKALEEKLENLKVVKRAEVAEKIKVARSFGDISENSEYDAAKEEQSMLEGEISKIELTLRTAKIIDSKKIDPNVVSVGSLVKLHDVKFDEKVQYRILGTTEADPKELSISNESPLGRALLGKKKNDTIEIDAPIGKLQYKILGIN
jgi:transcription elongation factor GreA